MDERELLKEARSRSRFHQDEPRQNQQFTELLRETHRFQDEPRQNQQFSELLRETPYQDEPRQNQQFSELLRETRRFQDEPRQNQQFEELLRETPRDFQDEPPTQESERALESVPVVEERQSNLCRDIDMILTKNATEEARREKGKRKLKLQGLNDKLKIVRSQMLTKELEEARVEDQRVEQILYESIENGKNLKTYFMGTAVLVEEMETHVESFSSRAETAIARSDRFSKNVEKLKEMKKQIGESQKLIRKLEEEVELKKHELNCNLEFHVDQDLVDENRSIRKMVEEKKLALKEKRLKKAQMKNHTLEKLTLLEEIYKKGEENRKLEDNLKKMEADLNDMRQKMPEQERVLKEKIAIDAEKLNKLKKDIQSKEQNIEEVDQEMEKIKQQAAEKQQKLGQQIEERHQYGNKIKEELNVEKLEVEALKNQIDEIVNKEEVLIIQKSKNATIISNLNDNEAELVAELLDEKTQLASLQAKLLGKEDGISILQMQIDAEKSDIEDLKAKKANIAKTLEVAKEQQRQLPVDYEQRHNDVSLKHKETLNVLLKKIRNAEADVELTEVSVEAGTQELETVLKWNKDYEQTITLEEVRIANQKRAAKRYESQIEDLTKQVELLQKKADKKSTKKSASDKQVTENKSQTTDQSLILEDEDTNMDYASGRKSPGILKSPFKKPFALPARRVTFDGLSSPSSSTTSNVSSEYCRGLNEI